MGRSKSNPPAATTTTDDEPTGADAVETFLAAAKAAAATPSSKDHPPAAGHATVTILAASKLPITQGRWVAMVGGSSARTGEPTHYHEAADREAGAPRGSPSWSGEPMEFDIADVTADLLLLLTSEAADGSQRCVGRIVVPLADLLPLNPFGAQPTPVQFWGSLFPPAAASAAPGAIDQRLTVTSGVPGAGLPPPRHGQQGAALVRVELTLNVSLLSAYTLIPPFEPTAVVAIDDATGREALPSERLLLAASRFQDVLSALPPTSLIVLTASRPWSAGLAILFLVSWLCFASSLAGLPWWLLTVWVANGASHRLLTASTEMPSPWEESSSSSTAAAASGGDSDGDAGAAPDDAGAVIASKLERLEAALFPLLRWLEASATLAERVTAAAAGYDPRASALLLVPIVGGAFAASLALAFLAALISLCGGAGGFAFFCAAALVVLNALTFHRNAVYAWMGAPHATAADGEDNGGWPLLPGGGGSSSSGGGGAAGKFASEQRDLAIAEVVSSASHARTVLSAMLSNVVARVPDAPTEASRNIARMGNMVTD